MESIKHALGETLGSEVVRLLKAVERGDHDSIDGTQALAWVRSRYFQYYEAGKWHSDPTSDLGRISRQQDFLRRLMAQAVEKGALNPIRASHLADAAMANLTVDSTFDVKDALRVVQAFRPVGPNGIEMVTLPTKSVGVHLAVSADAQPILARLRGEVPAPAGGEASSASTVPRVTPADVRALAGLQRELVRGAAALLRPGGSLVYSVCTLTAEESVGVVGELLDDFEEEEVSLPLSPHPIAGAGPGGFLLPQVHDTDGMYVARLRSKA